MRVRRGELLDVKTVDNRAAVFVGGQVIVLSEVATSILRMTPANGAISEETLTGALIEKFGTPEPPANAAELTRRQLADLVAHGILVHDEAADVAD